MTNQNNTQTAFLFPNLFAAITAEKQKQFAEFTEVLNKAETIEEILKGGWYLTEPMTAGAKRKTWTDLTELKAYILKRKEQNIEKALDKKLILLKEISNSPDLAEINISVDWKRSATWGANPRGEARVKTVNGYANTYDSGSVGGCGYDKLSTAVANCLNQSKSVLKALYLVKEQHIGKDNREVFGYGSGYGICPNFEGGVGVSCFPDIFRKIGFEFKQIANGKTFDVFHVTKKA
jgi:hypothetical protein